MSLSASSAAASDSGAASPPQPQSSPRPVQGGDRRCPTLPRVRSHALVNFGDDGEAGAESIIIPQQISLENGSQDLLYETGSQSLQGVSSRMEDRVLVVDLSCHPHFRGARRAVLVAVLDGHAGSGAVSYLEANIAQHLLEEVARQIGCAPVLLPPKSPAGPAPHLHHQHRFDQPGAPGQELSEGGAAEPKLAGRPAPSAGEPEADSRLSAGKAHEEEGGGGKAGATGAEAATAKTNGHATVNRETAVRDQRGGTACGGSSGVAGSGDPPPSSASQPPVPEWPVQNTSTQAQQPHFVPLPPLPESTSGPNPAALQQLRVALAPPHPPPRLDVSARALGSSPDGPSTDPRVGLRGASASSTAYRIQTPAGQLGSDPWAPAQGAEAAAAAARDPWAAGCDDGEEGLTDAGYEEDEEAEPGSDDALPWEPPRQHSAAAERRRSSQATYDSGGGCQPPDPPGALRNALLRCERELMELDCQSGSTALVALMLGASLWLANVGDCRAVVCDDGEARQLTVDHKAVTGLPDAPGEPEGARGAAEAERQRLMAAGAQLSADGYLQVTAPDGSCSDLAVSRNLGCSHLKDRCTSGRGSSWSLRTPHSRSSSHSRRNSRSGSRDGCLSGSGGAAAGVFGRASAGDCGYLDPGAGSGAGDASAPGTALDASDAGARFRRSSLQGPHAHPYHPHHPYHYLHGGSLGHLHLTGGYGRGPSAAAAGQPQLHKHPGGSGAALMLGQGDLNGHLARESGGSGGSFGLPPWQIEPHPTAQPHHLHHHHGSHHHGHPHHHLLQQQHTLLHHQLLNYGHHRHPVHPHHPQQQQESLDRHSGRVGNGDGDAYGASASNLSSVPSLEASSQPTPVPLPLPAQPLPTPNSLPALHSRSPYPHDRHLNPHPYRASFPPPQPPASGSGMSLLDRVFPLTAELPRQPLSQEQQPHEQEASLPQLSEQALGPGQDRGHDAGLGQQLQQPQPQGRQDEGQGPGQQQQQRQQSLSADARQPPPTGPSVPSLDVSPPPAGLPRIETAAATATTTPGTAGRAPPAIAPLTSSSATMTPSFATTIPSSTPAAPAALNSPTGQPPRPPHLPTGLSPRPPRPPSSGGGGGLQSRGSPRPHPIPPLHPYPPSPSSALRLSPSGSQVAAGPTECPWDEACPTAADATASGRSVCGGCRPPLQLATRAGSGGGSDAFHASHSFHGQPAGSLGLPPLPRSPTASHPDSVLTSSSRSAVPVTYHRGSGGNGNCDGSSAAVPIGSLGGGGGVSSRSRERSPASPFSRLGAGPRLSPLVEGSSSVEGVGDVCGAFVGGDEDGPEAAALRSDSSYTGRSSRDGGGGGMDVFAVRGDMCGFSSTDSGDDSGGDSRRGRTGGSSVSAVRQQTLDCDTGGGSEAAEAVVVQCLREIVMNGTGDGNGNVAVQPSAAGGEAKAEVEDANGDGVGLRSASAASTVDTQGAVLRSCATLSSWTMQSAFVHASSADLATEAAGGVAQAMAVAVAADRQPGTAALTTPAEAAAAGGGGGGADGGSGTPRSAAAEGPWLLASGASCGGQDGRALASGAALIPDPDLFHYQISQDSEFLICACDGLWDVMRNGEACRMVRRWLADGRSAAAAAESLCQAALKLGSHDNISVVVLRFSGRPFAVAPTRSMLLRRVVSEAGM